MKAIISKYKMTSLNSVALIAQPPTIRPASKFVTTTKKGRSRFVYVEVKA